MMKPYVTSIWPAKLWKGAEPQLLATLVTLPEAWRKQIKWVYCMVSCKCTQRDPNWAILNQDTYFLAP